MKVTVASVSQKDIDECLGSSVRGGTLTVGNALDMRHAKVEDVVVWETAHGFEAIVYASTPEHKNGLVHSGVGSKPFYAVFDAFAHLATMATRP